MIVERDANSVLVAAKKADDAIKEGLENLGATLDEVKVEVVESGGIFRKAKVRLTLEKDEPAEPVSDGKTDKAEKQEKSVRSDKPVKAEKTEKQENPGKSDKTEKQEKAEIASDAVPAVMPDKNKPSDNAVNSAEKPERADKTAKPEKADAEKPEKAAKKPLPKSQAPTRKDAPTGEQPQNEKRKVSREEEVAALGKAFAFVKSLVAKMGFEAQIEQDPDNPELIKIDAPSGDDSLIIGRHGETLAALSYLAETGARADKCRVSVTVDCNGYRDRRAASLSAMAHRRADEAVNKGRRIKLEPMERIDRRTIHNALTDDDRVSTASEGKEPYRFVVIIPNDERRGGKPRRGGRHDKFERDVKSQVAHDESSSENAEE